MQNEPISNISMTRADKEAKRQAKDRNRVRNAHAYRYILGAWKREGQVPSIKELARWLEDAKYSVRAPKLIEDMVKKGWLQWHGPGYKLITQLSPERLIPQLIEAHEQRDEHLWDELVQLWQTEQGRAARKL